MVFVVALGSFTFGFNNSVIGSVLGLKSFFDYFDIDQNGGGRADSIIGATSGLFAGGGALGSLALAPLANRAGRIRAIQVTCIICIIAGIIQAASVHIIMFLIGRFLSGLGVGLMVTLVPIYQSEISPAESRGKMVGSHGTLIVTGYAFAAWTGFGCFYSPNPEFQWRFELSAQVIAPCLLLVGSLWLPESPRWLVEQNRHTEALEILSSFHSSDYQDEVGREDKAQLELSQIRAQLVADREIAQSAGRWALVTKPSYRKRLIAGCITQFLSQSTGVLVINNYQVMLYNSLGLYESLPLLLYAAYLTWAAGMNYISALIIDRVGRVRLMTIGLLGGAAAVICEAAMVAKFSGTSNKVGNGFGVAFLFLFVTFYGVCLDATTWVYCAEIFPTHTRSRGMGISIFTQFCTTLVFTQAAPMAFNTIGWRYYLVFIIIPVLGAVVMFFTFPETKGLSLEDISMVFGDEQIGMEVTPEPADRPEKLSVCDKESV
ncbi:Sugar/inositol transporter [Penicillium camemberti]|uniref:Sugar/inositol transporter n=1 Tax=Penicillium camemberti (strain FM 013) TaxID=1429867 RepID=A0A0G4PSD2_PENC3|nr:Sugar/inositol transporter [Penicillium camemberti]